MPRLEAGLLAASLLWSPKLWSQLVVLSLEEACRFLGPLCAGSASVLAVLCLSVRICFKCADLSVIES